MNRLNTVACSVAVSMLLAAPAWAAWPEDKPIEVVVGFAPGGGTDLMARKLAPFLQKHLGGKAQFIVVNKPGASGELSNAYVAKARPDGYTLGIVNYPAYLYVPLARKAQYQPEDLRLIARVVDDPTVLVARAESNIGSLQTFVGVLKQAPGTLAVAHNGEGSNGDLVLQLLTAVTGARINAIPYKGTGQQKTDLLGGHVALGTVSAGELPELHKGGKGPLKAIVQFTQKRSQALPNVPTAVEAGVPVFMSSERGVAAPRDVDPTIASRLEKAIADSLKDPEFLATASADAPVLSFMPGAQWAKSMELHTAALRKLAGARR
jgi:tripartite-type tricarboxylate transporter receptor subunit TctC